MQVPPFSLSQQISDLSADLERAVLSVLQSGQYIGGAQIQQFEAAFAASTGVDFAVGCNSGTDALILALRALGVGAGDEVITCSFSFFATAEAISAVGATPVFVDVDPSTYLIDLDQIEAVITPRSKALIPVHLFGRPVDMTRCMSIATTHNLKVVEDCAQATGATWAGQPVGSFGDVGCFSFFPTKIIEWHTVIDIGSYIRAFNVQFTPSIISFTEPFQADCRITCLLNPPCL